MRHTDFLLIPVVIIVAFIARPLAAFEANIPVLVPLTGFLSLREQANAMARYWPWRIHRKMSL